MHLVVFIKKLAIKFWHLLCNRGVHNLFSFPFLQRHSFFNEQFFLLEAVNKTQLMQR